MDHLLREATLSCLKHLQAIAAAEDSPESIEREKAALAEDLPRFVNYLSMLPGADRRTFMPICGGIRRLIYENDDTYQNDTLQELNDLLAALEKGQYRAIRETANTMLWASMMNSLNHLRNLRYFQPTSDRAYELERARLGEEIERYRRSMTAARLTLPHRQAHEFILKGMSRAVTEGDVSRIEPVESKLVAMLVEY